MGLTRCVAASSLGAPHQRRRWFCLAVRPSHAARLAERIQSAPDIVPFDWVGASQEERMILEDSPLRRKRCAALGNAVVPDCVRRAFNCLAPIPVIDDDTTITQRLKRKRCNPADSVWPPWGTLHPAENRIRPVKPPLHASGPGIRYTQYKKRLWVF